MTGPNETGTNRIVVVEDDMDACRMIKTILSNDGYEVTSDVSGHFILETPREAPDLFILDHSLPTITGVAVCKFIRVQQLISHIPVIIISANHDIEAKAYKAGASRFLGKPFLGKDLLTIVQSILLQ